MTNGRTDVRKAFYNLPTTAFGRRQEIIKHRLKYVRMQKVADNSKDDELDLLGDEDVESFAGSHADLERAADNLFASPPRPQPLRFEALFLKTPAKTVSPTPVTVL